MLVEEFRGDESFRVQPLGACVVVTKIRSPRVPSNGAAEVSRKLPSAFTTSSWPSPVVIASPAG